MLQVNNISLAYGARLVLDNVSFTVAPGEKAGLIGVNGAGKSSLLKIVAGYQEADSGTVMLPRTFGYPHRMSPTKPRSLKARRFVISFLVALDSTLRSSNMKS